MDNFECNLLYRRRMADFFGDYINEKDAFILHDGTFSRDVVEMIIELLLDNHKFTSIRDMQKTALRTCSVFLSYDLFETYLNEVNKE